MSGEGEVGRPRRWCATALAATLGATVAALAVVVGGCGGDGGERSGDDAAARAAVARAVHAIQRSFQTGDRERLCEWMDATARRQAGLVAHGRPDGCAKDLGEAFGVIDAGGGLRATRRPRLLAARVSGDDATATVAVGGHGRVDVPLVRDGAAWRLGSFFGTRPPRDGFAPAPARAAAPDPGARGVVVESGGAPCWPLLADSYPHVDGGCALAAAARAVRLAIGTAFGYFTFGTCELGYRVLVDDNGRTWTDSVVFRGPGNVNNGCSDVGACEDADNDPLPWPGRISITGDGRFAHRMDVCLDTCIGLYVGPLTVTLSKGGRGWRATAANAGVGRSGLRLDGGIALGGDGLRLSRASR